MGKNKILRVKELSYTFLLIAFFLSAMAYAQEPPSKLPDMVQTKTGMIKVGKLASLSEPWGMAWLPDGRLLVTEKPGRLRIYSEGKLSDPVKGLPKIEYHGPNPDGSIPQDNPFINRKGVRTDIWSFGHRNPLGAALNPTSKQLWILEMGAVHEMN